jgi:hypothetical protein
MYSFAEGREFDLVFLNHRPADEASSSRCLLKDGDQFLPMFLVKTDQIRKWDIVIVFVLSAL